VYIPIEVAYYEDAWKVYEDDDRYAELREQIPMLPSPRPRWGAPELWADMPTLLKLTELGINFGIQKDKLAGATGTMIVKMQERIASGERHVDAAKAAAAGHAVQIAIPDLGLLNITEVTWLEDCCTEVLQEHLTDGWRLLAVCPPNAQRRPDYILGRSKA